MRKKHKNINLKHNLKNVKISKTAKIKSNFLQLENNVSISSNVELVAERIVISEGASIGAGTKIHCKIIEIGQNSTIKKNCNIFVKDKFSLGNRSDLCECHITGRNIKIGNDFFSSNEAGTLLTIGGGGSLLPQSSLTIGDGCTIHNVFINIAMPVKIGNDVGISPFTKFYTHYFWNSIFEGHPQKFSGIRISDGCIIGANSMFLPGISIGKNCIIGAGSVVTKSFPSSCVIAGNPSKIIRHHYKKRISPKKRLELLKSTLKWYMEILRTKGFTIKKINKEGLNYQVTNSNGIKTRILYYSERKKLGQNFRAIIISFQNFPVHENTTILNLATRKIIGIENDLTDDLRDFLRKVGIRVFSNRRFRSIPLS